MATSAELQHMRNQLRMLEDRLIRAKTTAEIEQMQLVVMFVRKNIAREERRILQNEYRWTQGSIFR